MDKPERRLAAIVVGVLVLGLCFAGSFITAFHEPRPHDLEVGIVAPAPVAQQLETTLQQRMPDAFDVQRYDTPQDARAAVLDRDVSGAFVAGPEPQLIIASAGGRASSDVLEAAFGAAAKAQGQQLQVADAAPLPDHDPQGLSIFFLATSMLLPSLVLAIATTMAVREASALAQTVALTAFALLLAMCNVGLADFVLGALPDHYLALVGITALFSLAISLPTAGLVRMHPSGIPLALLVLVILSFPASGGPGGLAQFMPEFFRWIDSFLPLSAVVPSLRNTMYFDSANVGGPVLILSAWAIAGLALLLASGRFGTAHTAHDDAHTTVPAGRAATTA